MLAYARAPGAAAALTAVPVRALRPLSSLLQFAFVWSGRPGVSGPIANTLPFIVMPIVWRVHVSALPGYQQRCVALAMTAASAIAMAILAGPPIELRAALAAMAVGVSSIGWRMGDAGYGAQSPIMNSVLVRGVLIGTSYQLAGWLPLLASGHSMLDPYWPGRTIFTIDGIAISVGDKRWHVERAE